MRNKAAVGRIDSGEDTTTLGFRLEGEMQFNSSAIVSQRDGGDLSEPLIADRIVEVLASHPRFGTLTLGQGPTASDGTSEIDIPGTGLVGYSSVQDLAGGTFFNCDDGGLADTSVGDVFSSPDSLGRKVRVRYDTPTVAGLAVSVSHTEDDARDVALTYEKDIEGAALWAFRIFAVVAWIEDRFGPELVNGSVSVLHEPTGVSVMLAAARGSATDGAPDPRLRYTKIGYQTDAWLDAGTTAVSLDVARNDDVGAAGDDARS